jgi:hypothetical protein
MDRRWLQGTRMPPTVLIVTNFTERLFCPEKNRKGLPIAASFILRFVRHATPTRR